LTGINFSDSPSRPFNRATLQSLTPDGGRIAVSGRVYAHHEHRGRPTAAGGDAGIVVGRYLPHPVAEPLKTAEIRIGSRSRQKGQGVFTQPRPEPDIDGLPPLQNAAPRDRDHWPRFTRSTIKPTTRDNQAVALLDNPGVASRDGKDKHYKPPYSSPIPFDIGLLRTYD
jgi:hypothetical protein